jgi:hypothetical protein
VPAQAQAQAQSQRSKPRIKNAVVSRTLGKVALVLQHEGKPPKVEPKPEEFWLCDLVTETRPSEPAGCFLVEPLQKVEHKNLVLVTPSSCTLTKVYRTILLAEPIELTHNGQLIPWFMPLPRKRELLSRDDVVSVITTLGGHLWARNG